MRGRRQRTGVRRRRRSRSLNAHLARWDTGSICGDHGSSPSARAGRAVPGTTNDVPRFGIPTAWFVSSGSLVRRTDRTVRGTGPPVRRTDPLVGRTRPLVPRTCAAGTMYRDVRFAVTGASVQRTGPPGTQYRAPLIVLPTSWYVVPGPSIRPTAPAKTPDASTRAHLLNRRRRVDL